jgi:hypothetical protein
VGDFGLADRARRPPTRRFIQRAARARCGLVPARYLERRNPGSKHLTLIRGIFSGQADAELRETLAAELKALGLERYTPGLDRCEDWIRCARHLPRMWQTSSSLGVPALDLRPDLT